MICMTVLMECPRSPKYFSSPSTVEKQNVPTAAMRYIHTKMGIEKRTTRLRATTLSGVQKPGMREAILGPRKRGSTNGATLTGESSSCAAMRIHSNTSTLTSPRRVQERGDLTSLHNVMLAKPSVLTPPPSNVMARLQCLRASTKRMTATSSVLTASQAYIRCLSVGDRCTVMYPS
jgi:hypothetical protein